jgi:hypothetical protein
MKRSILAFGVVLICSSQARAEGGPFGLGLVVGTPTGLSLEYKLSSHTAIDGAVGVDLFFDRHLYVQGDFLFLLGDLLGGGDVGLTPYLGPGAFVADFGGKNGGAGFGVRGPFGLMLDFTRAPLQIYGEFSLNLELVRDVHLGVGGAVGFRYFF